MPELEKYKIFVLCKITDVLMIFARSMVEPIWFNVYLFNENFGAKKKNTEQNVH